MAFGNKSTKIHYIRKKKNHIDLDFYINFRVE